MKTYIEIYDEDTIEYTGITAIKSWFDLTIVTILDDVTNIEYELVIIRQPIGKYLGTSITNGMELIRDKVLTLGKIKNPDTALWFDYYTRNIRHGLRTKQEITPVTFTINGKAEFEKCMYADEFKLLHGFDIAKLEE